MILIFELFPTSLLAFGALKGQVLDEEPNDPTYISLKNNLGLSDNEISQISTKYINNGNRCN